MTREAELELEIARLREALNDERECWSDIAAYDQNPEWWRLFAKQAVRRIEQALSTPPSTTALQELIEKVERRTIERCAELLSNVSLPDLYSQPCIDETVDEIRALPTGNLKLEDLL